MSAAKWERGECRVVTQAEPTRGEQWTAWFSDAAPGLAVTEIPHVTKAAYTITHVSTGRAAAQGFDTLADAQKGALIIARLADWVTVKQPVMIPGLRTRIWDALDEAGL